MKIFKGKNIIICVLIGFALVYGKRTYAQQIPQYTQYMFNTYITNPAVAGTSNSYQMRLNNRYQWVGFTDAPYTVNISFWGPFSKRDMGWGAYVSNDVTGPTSRTSAMGTYAYNLQLNDDGLRVSGGISFGMLLYKLDGSKLTVGEEADPQYDPAIIGSTKTVVTPDASIGFYLYSSSFNVGIAAHQLFGQRLKFYQVPIKENRLKQHIMVSGGYFVPLNRDMNLEANGIIKYMFSSPMQVEINGKLEYRLKTSFVWGGLSLRWKDAISILMGIDLNKKYKLGYSFDWSLLGISKYNSGSHEIMLGYMFDKIK